MMQHFTPEQMAVLEPMERFFSQAVQASWCSYPGQANINILLEYWQQLTGQPYPYKPGCPNCLLNLVRDAGAVYFATKASSTPAEGAKAPVTDNNTKQRKKAEKRK